MALDVILLKTPYEISFTGNPMPFLFSLAPYGPSERAQDIRLQVRILIEQAFDSMVYEEVYDQNFYPDGNGQVLFDIKTVVDPYLDYYLPKPSLKRPVEAKTHRKRYKLSWLLQQNGAQVGTVTESDIFFAIKGGLSYEQWHSSEFFSSVILGSRFPLNFAAAGEMVALYQPLFLWWLYPYDDLAAQVVHFVFTLDDNSVINYPHPVELVTAKWGVCCCPVGFTQIDNDGLIPDGRTIVSLFITVAKEDNTVVAFAYYYFDYRAFYDTYLIMYRNSLGALETVRMRGQVDFETDYVLQQATRTVPPAYFSNQNLLPQQIQENTLETTKFTGDTGFMSLAAINKLRDLFLSPQVIEISGNKYLPVVLLNKTVKFYANRDSLLSVQLQWQRAFTNQFYTPAAYMPASRTCPVVEQFVVTQINKNTLLIMYSLAEPYDQIEVQILNGDSSEDLTVVYTGNSGSILQTFTNPVVDDPVDITVKGRTICDADADPIDYGAFTTLTVTVNGNSLPVANDDTYAIDSGYSSAVTLTGSVMANDYDPDDDAISVVPDSGSTDAGGTYSIDAAGIISYTPPSSSYVGNDSFEYELTDGTATVTATVTIKVGNSNLVYVRSAYLNTTITSGPTVYGEVWLFFSSDPTGSSPLDVSSLGLTVNVKEHTYTQDEFGAQTNTDATTGYAVYGTSYRVYTGLISKTQTQSGWAYPRVTSHNWSVQPGTGYIPS